MCELLRIGTSNILATCVFGLLVIYVIQFYVNVRRMNKKMNGIRGPFPLPLIGSGYMFIGSIDDIMSKILDISSKYESPMCNWLGPTPVVISTKPEDMQIVLTNPLTVGKGLFYKFFDTMAGNGIFATYNIPLWKKNRKIVNNAFSPKMLNSFFTIFKEQGELLAKFAEESVGKGPIDCTKPIEKCHVNIIFNTCIGSGIESEQKIMKWVHSSLENVALRMFKIWLYPNFIWKCTKIGREFNSNNSKSRQATKEIIKQKRVAMASDVSDNPDKPKSQAFLDKLLVEAENNESLTETQLIDETLTMIAAGTDTTSVTEGYALLLIAMHPDIQEQLYKEQQTIFGNVSREFNLEDLAGMVLLERVIKETMRLFPAGPLVSRAAAADVPLSKGILPKGMTALLPIIEMHRDPNVWKDPLKFDPDRYLPENFSKLHPYAYIPFSAGLRNCVGSKFSMMAMKVILSIMIRNFKMTTPVQRVEDIKYRVEITLTCAIGYPIVFEKRIPS